MRESIKVLKSNYGLSTIIYKRSGHAHNAIINASNKDTLNRKREKINVLNKLLSKFIKEQKMKRISTNVQLRLTYIMQTIVDC